MLLKSVVIKRWGYIQHQQPQKTTRNELIASSRRQFALQVTNSGRKHRLQLCNISYMLISSFTDKYTYP